MMGGGAAPAPPLDLAKLSGDLSAARQVWNESLSSYFFIHLPYPSRASGCLGARGQCQDQ